MFERGVNVRQVLWAADAAGRALVGTAVLAVGAAIALSVAGRLFGG